jgi:desulfoferrodoxin (superoxide reductase-like protein)
MIHENLTGKGDVQHKLKGLKPYIQNPKSKDRRNLQGNHHFQVQRKINLNREQPQPECEIVLCTPDIVDVPIINLQDAGRPFKIKVSTIRMIIVRALEHFNEYIQAKFLEWHIGLLKRRMEKMEIEKEAQHLKAAEARSTCKECEEYGHVQG